MKVFLSLLVSAAAIAADVNLGFEWITDSDIRALADRRDIRKLDLSLSLITDGGVERLSTLPNVADLNLSATERITDAGIAYLRGWKHLERLNLRGTDITDTSVQYLAQLTTLRWLDISYTQVTNNGMEYLAALRNLEELRIGANQLTGSGLHVLKLLPRLTRLSLAGNQKRNTDIWQVALTDFDLESVGKLAPLQSLDLGGRKISDLGVGHLKGLAELRSLDLGGTRVTNAAIKELSALPKLERLNLWRVKGIGDAGMADIAAIKTLATFDLSETPITDKGLASLAAAKSLRLIYLTGTKVTAGGVEGFRRENRQCQVDWIASE